MPCTDIQRRRLLRRGSALGLTAVAAALAGLGGLSGCAPLQPAPAPAPVPPRPSQPPAPPPAKPAAPLARNWNEYRHQAALRLVQASPGRSYTGPVPEPLKGIPILEIELNADGSVRHIAVQREPKPANARHTTQLAIEAVRRAAPFAPVGHLPRPWKFTEVFLFDDDDRFKPRTLDV